MTTTSTFGFQVTVQRHLIRRLRRAVPLQRQSSWGMCHGVYLIQWPLVNLC